MEITAVRMSLVEEDQIRAFTSIIFDRCFTVRGVQLLEIPEGYPVRMPTVKRPDGTFTEIVFPPNAKTQKMIEDKVISEYKKVIAANRLLEIQGNLRLGTLRAPS
jgi:stage V sporulation protein G